VSFTLPIGSPAPDFSLPGTDGHTHSLASFKDARLLLVAFWCNHCPYVIGTEEHLIRLTLKYAPEGLRVVAINSNETENHPLDSFEHMVKRVHEKSYPFTYLRDESQDIALAYGALRTPHFYLFDHDRKLRYTGRLNDHPKFPQLATTHELQDAIDALLACRTPTPAVTNPFGCNIKWRNREEHWLPADACDLLLPGQPLPPNPKPPTP
jgi:peroxiredoxin